MRTSNRSRPILPTLWAAAILTVLWLFFFWRLLTPSDDDRVIFAQGDFPLHFFAFSDYQAGRMWQGEIPLWNPYNYGGEPFAANMQFEVWYPPRWIAVWLAGPHGWRIEAHQMEAALHYWLASLLMYAFLRLLVRRPLAALLGSLLWTYGGYLTGYPMLQPAVVESITWLPAVMAGAHLSLAAPGWRVRGIVLGGAMLGLAFLGGHAQTTLLMAYLAAAYLAYTGWQRSLPWHALAWRIGLLALVGVSLAAVQLLPSIEFIRLAYRTEDFHYLEKSAGFHFAELVQIVWPRLFRADWWPLYTGVTGLLLALTAVLRPHKKHYFWIGTAAVALLLSLGAGTSLYDLFYLAAPGFSFFRQQERAASLVAFAVAVLAAYQLDRVLSPRHGATAHRLTWLARAHLALVLPVFLIVALVLEIRGDHPKSVTADALGFVALISLLLNGWLAWWRQDRRRIVAGGLALIVIVDLFSLGMKSSNFVPDDAGHRVAPPDHLDVLSRPPDEIAWHVDGAAGLQGRSMFWRIPDIYGVVPFYLASTEKLRQIRVDRRWEVFAVRYATMIADVPDNVPVTAIGEGTNYDGAEYTLYELDDPRPFAHLVYDVRVSDAGQDGARAMMNEPVIDLRAIGVTTEPLPFDLPGQRPAESRVEAFKMVMPEYLEMSVSTGENALLTLPVADYPGWRAEINGEPVDIIDTYAGMIGVPVPAGQNQKVTLRFLPTSVIAGGVISGLAALAILVYLAGAVMVRGRSGNPLRRVYRFLYG